MNTFLPYPDFESSARALDNKRLGKQRVECIQLLLALWWPEHKYYDLLWREMGYKTCDPSRTKPPAYINHPCTKMWRGQEATLGRYLGACLREWEQRGFDSARCDKFWDLAALPNIRNTGGASSALHSPPLHANHRALLLHKAPEWYSQWGWTEKPCEKAWWPVD